jgi:hypothetical protein
VVLVNLIFYILRMKNWVKLDAVKYADAEQEASLKFAALDADGSAKKYLSCRIHENSRELETIPIDAFLPAPIAHRCSAMASSHVNEDECVCTTAGKSPND